MKYPNNIYLGIVYDAMRISGHKSEHFFIDIKPKIPIKKTIYGPAFTTKGRKVKKNEDYEKLDMIRIDMYQKKYFNNHPIVILEANDQKCAHSGDITSQIYKSLGAKGFVTDGNVRDLDLISKLNFPTFCKDVNPIDAINYWALTEYQIPISIQNVKISPNDIIFASSEGIIVVGKKDISKFDKNIISLIKKEAGVRSLVNKIKNKSSYKKDLTRYIKKNGRW